MAELLDLSFKTLDGGSFSLQLPSDMELGAVAELVAEELVAQRQRRAGPSGGDAGGRDVSSSASTPDASSSAITPERIRFIFKGQALQHSRSLESYGVQSGQSLHVVVRPSPQQQQQPHPQPQQQQPQASPPRAAQTPSGQPQLRVQWSPITLTSGGGAVLLGGLQLDGVSDAEPVLSLRCKWESFL